MRAAVATRVRSRCEKQRVRELDGRVGSREATPHSVVDDHRAGRHSGRKLERSVSFSVASLLQSENRTPMKTKSVNERSLTALQLASCVGGISTMAGIKHYGQTMGRRGILADRLQRLKDIEEFAGPDHPELKEQKDGLQHHYDWVKRRSEQLERALDTRLNGPKTF
jgi:hypothetical protein